MLQNEAPYIYKCRLMNQIQHSKQYNYTAKGIDLFINNRWMFPFS